MTGDFTVAVLWGDSLLAAGVAEMLLREGLMAMGIDVRREDPRQRLRALQPVCVIVDSADSLLQSSLGLSDLFSLCADTCVLRLRSDEGVVEVYRCNRLIASTKDELLAVIRSESAQLEGEPSQGGHHVRG